MTLDRNDDLSVLSMDNGKANAMNPALLVELDQAFAGFHEVDTLALVITGYDRFFSAGLDLVTLSDLDREGMLGFMRLFKRVMRACFTIRRPVVAAVNGHAVAGGCVLAVQADWRVIADGKSKFGLNETRLGVGLPTCAAESLRCQVPPASFIRTTLEGELFDPQQALALGLVHEVAPAGDVLERASEKARELAQVPPPGFAQVKAVIRAHALECIDSETREQEQAWLDTWFHPVTTGLRQEAVAQLTARA